jgi:hypothetical protein
VAQGPFTDLPELSESQKAASLTEEPPEEWARVKLAYMYSMERPKKKAERTASIVEIELARMPSARFELFQYQAGGEQHRLTMRHKSQIRSAERGCLECPRSGRRCIRRWLTT